MQTEPNTFIVSAGEDEATSTVASNAYRHHHFLTSPSGITTPAFPTRASPNKHNGSVAGFGMFASNSSSAAIGDAFNDSDAAKYHPLYPPPPPPPPLSGGQDTGGDGDAYGSRQRQLSPPQMPPPPLPHARRNHRLHQDFKALSKDERKRLVDREAAESDLLSRTVHLRFLPTTMLQSELAAICTDCGPYLRVRICGNSTNNQNWIYGFVEFATKEGAANMMRKCGMELHNGPGRPPLRLKCNCAKQPIVDRVFHDADPATNTPCIFGLGNFAHRTIKDALDSYFNLKEKEAAQEQQQQQQHLTVSRDTGVGGGFHGLQAFPSGSSQPSSTPKLSPHAKAFQPNPSAAVFVPASLSLGATNAQAAANHTALHGGGSRTAAPSPSLSDGDSETSFRTGNASGNQGPLSFSTGHPNGNASDRLTPCYGASGATLGGRTPPSVPPHPFFSCSHGGNGRQPSDVPSAGGLSATPTFTTAAYYPSLSSPSPLAAMTGANGSTFPTAAAATNAYYSSPSAVDALVLPPASTTEAVASQLSLALQAMMDNSDMRTQKAVAEAEEVLQRAYSLLDKAVVECKLYASTGKEGFFDAVGTLKSLLEVIEKHAETFVSTGVTPCFDHDANGDLPSLYLASEGERGRRRLHNLCLRATQLRLLANLLSALLYMRRRSFVDALPFIHAIVTITNAIPSSRLKRAASAAASSSSTASATSRASPSSSLSATSSTILVGGLEAQRGQALGEEEPCSPIGAPGSNQKDLSAEKPQPQTLSAFADADAAAAHQCGSPISANGVDGNHHHEGLFTFMGSASEDLLRAVLESLSDGDDVEDEEGHAGATDGTGRGDKAGSDGVGATFFAHGEDGGDDNNHNNNSHHHHDDPDRNKSQNADRSIDGRRESQRETPDGEGAAAASSSCASGRDHMHCDTQCNAGNASRHTDHSSGLGPRACVVLDEESYQQEVEFHCFVLNTLLTVGLALEEVQPLVMSSTYALAAGRAKDVLGQTCSLLTRSLALCDPSNDKSSKNEPLREGEAPCLLSSQIPELAALMMAEKEKRGGKSDMTTFPIIFFASLPPLVSEDGESVMTNDALWHRMPPLHLVRLFPCDSEA